MRKISKTIHINDPSYENFTDISLENFIPKLNLPEEISQIFTDFFMTPKSYNFMIENKL